MMAETTEPGDQDKPVPSTHFRRLLERIRPEDTTAAQSTEPPRTRRWDVTPSGTSCCVALGSEDSAHPPGITKMPEPTGCTVDTWDQVDAGEGTTVRVSSA